MPILLRGPDADELLDRARAALETAREAGGVPGQVHLGQQRRLDRKVGGRGQRRPLDGVRPERSERKVLVVRPFGLPRSVQVTGEKRRELPLEGWMEVAVAVVVESVRHGAPPCSASAGHRGLA